MISEKALLARVRPDKIDTVAVIVAASNVVIEDITSKGELVLKHLNKK